MFLFSCLSEYDKYNNYLNKQIKSNYLENIENCNYIVVIPKTGCYSCIENAELFFKKNINNKDYLFIFTRVESMKKIKIDIGEENLYRDNVIIDSNNIFYLYNIEDSSYPIILEKSSDGKFYYERISL